MEVTEVRIKLMEGSEDRLRAFCSITLDHCFVIRDLKIIDGLSGPFVAMPSRKLSSHCFRCHYKNHLRAAYCNQCGVKLKAPANSDLPQKLYADVAHPVNSECRERISAVVLAEFEHELARAAEPGYRSRYDDDFDAISESSDDFFTPKSRPADTLTPGRDDPPPIHRVDPPRPAGASPSPPHLPNTSGAGKPGWAREPDPASPPPYSQASHPKAAPPPADSPPQGRPAPDPPESGGFGAGIFD